MRGYSRGFMKSLMNPIAIIVTSIISIAYYQSTNDIVTSLAIGLIGPLALGIVLKFILNLWPKTFYSDVRTNLYSSLAGSVLTFAWGWIFIIFTLILLTVLPPLEDALINIHNDVVKSMSYNLVAKPLGTNIFGILKEGTTAPDNAGNGEKSFFNDPRFQKIAQDPDVQQAVQAHDYVRLLSNPKVIALTNQVMSDPTALKEFMALYNNQKADQDQSAQK